jgi:predicted nucleic acid-binding protein
MVRCSGLAEQIGLAWYDASYLWLARRTEAELVTLDQRLDAAG